MASKQITDHFLEAERILQLFNKSGQLDNIERAGMLMVESLRSGGRIISCGNGGSMCDAMHFAEELSGRYRNDRPAISAISISDPSHITCVGNDFGFDFIFSRFIEANGRSGDVLLAISTSGKSGNVIQAVQKAKEIGMHVVALTGKDGGKLKELAHVEVRSPASKYADRAQEIHIKVIHALIDFIENNL